MRRAGRSSGRTRRWLLVGAAVVLALGAVWSLYERAPPDVAWVLVRPLAAPDRVESRVSPDGTALRDEWFVFATLQGDDPYHLHRTVERAGWFRQAIDRISGSGSPRPWRCAPCRPTGQEQETESGTWIEVARSGPEN